MTGGLIIFSLIVLQSNGLTDIKHVQICYHIEEVKTLSCRGEKVIMISELVEKRAKSDCTKHTCCFREFDTKIHNVKNDTKHDIQLLQSVLSECNQKKYCVITDDFLSEAFEDQDFTVGDGMKAIYLIVLYKCVDTDARSLMCKDSSAQVSGNKQLHITFPSLELSSLGEIKCQCDVRSTGNVNLTLMDVRLSDNANDNLILFNGERGKTQIINGGNGSIYFGKTVPLTKAMTITLSLSQVPLNGNIWMKVQGNQNSKASATCYDTEAQLFICQNNSAVATGGKQMYITIPNKKLFSYGKVHCHCDVRSTGFVTVTLIDVRLGANQNDKLILSNDNRGQTYKFNGGKDSTYFDQPVHMSKSMAITLSLRRIVNIGDLWMKVQGKLNSEVRITCEESDSLRTAALHLMDNETEDETGLLRYILFSAGFGTGFVLLGLPCLIIILVKRKSKHKRNRRPKSTYPSSRTSRQVEGADHEPVYDSLDQEYVTARAPPNRESFAQRESYCRNSRTPDYIDQKSVYSEYGGHPIPKPRSRRDLNVYSEIAEPPEDAASVQ